MRLTVAVIGAGSWGTTVASVASHNCPTVLWARNPEIAEEINDQRTNYALSRHLRGWPRPARHGVDGRGGARRRRRRAWACRRTAFAPRSSRCAQHIRAWVPVISLAKGLEQDTLLRMTR